MLKVILYYHLYGVALHWNKENILYSSQPCHIFVISFLQKFLQNKTTTTTKIKWATAARKTTQSLMIKQFTKHLTDSCSLKSDVRRPTQISWEIKKINSDGSGKKYQRHWMKVHVQVILHLCGSCSSFRIYVVIYLVIVKFSSPHYIFLWLSIKKLNG